MSDMVLSRGAYAHMLQIFLICSRPNPAPKTHWPATNAVPALCLFRLYTSNVTRVRYFVEWITLLGLATPVGFSSARTA